MSKLIFTAAIVSLLTACSGMPYKSRASASSTTTMGASAMPVPAGGPWGASAGGPN